MSGNPQFDVLRKKLIAQIAVNLSKGKKPPHEAQPSRTDKSPGKNGHDIMSIRAVMSKANEDAKRMALLAAEESWVTHGLLITGQIQHCLGCGHRVLATTGYYNVQQHKHIKAKRLKATLTPDASLPTSRALDAQDFVVHICANCALEETDPLLSLAEAAAHTAPFVANQLPLF